MIARIVSCGIGWISLGGLYAQLFQGIAYGGIVGAQVAGDGMAGFHKGGIMGGFAIIRPIPKEWTLRWGLEVFQRGSARSVKDALEGKGRWERMRVTYLETPITLLLQIPNQPWRVGGVLSLAIRWEGQMVNTFGAIEPVDFLRRTDVNGRITIEYHHPRGIVGFFQTGQSLIGIGKQWARPIILSAYPGLLHIFIAAGIGYAWNS